MQIFAVKDTKAGTFYQPFVRTNSAVAERDFQTMCSDKNSLTGKYPEHFDLYDLGIFDERTGKMDLYESPMHVVKGTDLIQN